MPSSFPQTRTVLIHQDPVDFSMPQAFRVHTSLSSPLSFLLHALRARIVVCDKRNSSHCLQTFLYSSGRTFPHNVRTYLRRIRTDLINYRNLSGPAFIVRRWLLSFTRRSLPANHFRSRGPFRPHSVDHFLSRADRFHSRGPSNYSSFEQYVRTFLPTSDTDRSFPNGHGQFPFKRTFPHNVRT
jgi:hypothetical protein